MRQLLALLALLVPGATPAGAGTIQLTILAQPTVSETRLSVHLDVRNTGDTAAGNVMPILVFRGQETLGTLVQTLEPRASNLQTIGIPLEAASRIQGVWPLYVRLSYSDANNHPFEALHVSAVPFGTLAPQGVTLRLSGTRLTTTGEITAETTGPEGTPVSLSFVVPAGVAVTPEQATLALTGRSHRTTAFVTNAGATAPSTLPVFAVAEYNAGELHGTAIATAMVEIAGQQPDRDTPAGGSRALAAGGAVLVVLAGIAAMLARRRSTNPLAHGPADGGSSGNAADTRSRYNANR